MMESTAVMIFCLGTSFGIAIGLMAVFWPRSRKSQSFEAPYFKGSGEPQPGIWSPSRAIGHDPVKVYPSIDVWARETGAV